MNKPELPFIKDMFNTIAPRYDMLNRILSLRRDVSWRRMLVSELKLSENSKILDIACGTGDVGLEILKQTKNRTLVFSADFSHKMIKIAKKKAREFTLKPSVHFLAGDALRLPFRPETFNAVTMAFGIRNITDKLSALKAFHESLKKGGAIAVLELTTPEKGLLYSLYLLYFRKILPVIGFFVSGNSMAYQYLPESVINFPKSSVFAETMRNAGFINVSWKSLTLGIATLYMGEKE
jgi:demethylmenaquinone methyltransferase/2-methoxy-6-polyprenyl-1,4-benzoquinol methylase